MGDVLAPLRPAAPAPGRRPSRPRAHRAPAVAATLAAALVVTLAATLASSAPAAADDATLGVGAAPATHGALDGRTRFSAVVAPGQRVSDELLVRNTGTADARVEVYAADASTAADGAFAVADRAVTATGAGAWVTFDGERSRTLSLAAGAQAVVPFSLAVPADAAPGDHPAAVVASTASASGQVQVDRRVATRLYARVQGTVSPALTVASISATQAAGGGPLAAPTTITAVVLNTGDVALAAHVEAGVRTWFGAATGTTVEQELAELLPGATRTVTVTVDSVGRLGYLAPYLTLTPTADLAAYDFAGSLPPVLGRTTTAGVPWLLAGLVVLAAGALWFEVRRRRSRAAEAAAGSRPVPAAVRR